MKAKFRPPDVPCTEYLRMAHARTEYELAAPEWLRSDPKALMEAFALDYYAYEERPFRQSPANPRIAKWQKRFVGGNPD